MARPGNAWLKIYKVKGTRTKKTQRRNMTFTQHCVSLDTTSPSVTPTRDTPREATFQQICRYTGPVNDITKDIEPEPEIQFFLSIEEPLNSCN